MAAPDLPPRPRAKGRDVYVFFDNDVKVRAPFDALALRAALDDRKDLAPLPASLADVDEELRTDWTVWRGIRSGKRTG